MPLPRIDAQLSPLPPLPELAAIWQALEARARPGFFLSWTWIGSWLQWLQAHPVQPQLLSARAGGQIVGLAVVCRAGGTRRLRRGAPALFIHQTGIREFDRITIEYNGFVLDPDHAEAASIAMWRTLGADAAGSQEIQLSLFDLERLPAIATPKAMVPSMAMHATWVVDLARVRRQGGDYVATLSASRRANLRRALRSYAELGPLRVSEAGDAATARDYLARLKALHSRRWGDGNFASACVAPFHAALLAQALPLGQLQLLRVQAGTSDIGYLLNFVVDGHVYFYQSGFDYDLLEGRGTPGLATLALAIDHNLKAGHAVFDFLAGDMPYKAALGERRDVLCSLALRHDDIHTRIDDGLRRLARHLRELAEHLRPRLARHAVTVLAALVMPLTPEITEGQENFALRPSMAMRSTESDDEDDGDDTGDPREPAAA